MKIRFISPKISSVRRTLQFFYSGRHRTSQVVNCLQLVVKERSTRSSYFSFKPAGDVFQHNNQAAGGAVEQHIVSRSTTDRLSNDGFMYV